MTLISIKEAAWYLKVHEMTIYRLCKRGIVPAVKVGSKWRIVKERLDEQFEYPANGSGPKLPK